MLGRLQHQDREVVEGDANCGSMNKQEGIKKILKIGK